MKLLWKVKLDSTPRAMHNIFAPLIAESVATENGNIEMGLVAGVTDDLFGMDVSTGRVLWRRHFENRLPNQAPGQQHALPRRTDGGADHGARRAPGQYTVYAVSWEGRLYQVNLADGEDVAPPEKFVPGNGKPYALNCKDGVIYTASAQGCGGVTNAFYSFDLATRRASTFIPAGGGLWGRRGAAMDSDGRVYLGTGDGQFDPTTRRLGNAIVAVKIDANKQLQLADYFGAPNANWLWRRDLDVNTTPVVFDYRGRKFLVGTSKECRLWLLDRDKLGGDDHRTTLYTTPLICNDAQAFDGRGVWGALSAWQDPAGTQWVLVPFWGPVSKGFTAPTEHGRPKGGGVAAFKLEQRGRQVAADAGVAVARHGSGRGSGHCQRRRLRLRGWGGRDAGRAGRGLERARRSAVRRRPVEQRPDRRIPGSRKRRALRARRDRPAGNCGRAATQIDVVEPLQRTHSRQRPRLHRDVRRHAVQLRHRPIGGGHAMRAQRSLLVILASVLAGGVTYAQVNRGGSEWLTAQGDAQRTSWIRMDPKISVDAMSSRASNCNGRTKLDNQTRGLAGLTQGVTANGVTLFVPMSLVAGSSNNVYALDNDTGYVVWQRTSTLRCRPQPPAVPAASPRPPRASSARLRADTGVWGGSRTRRRRRRRVSQRRRRAGCRRAGRGARRRRGTWAGRRTRAGGAGSRSRSRCGEAGAARQGGGGGRGAIALPESPARPRRQGAAVLAGRPASSTPCRATACCT